MTGSAVADASGLGIMEIEAMRKHGYDDSFSCAITAASATIGPIFPPSIPMIFYAMLSGASIGKPGINDSGYFIRRYLYWSGYTY
jgi:TRAP-type C4-dicarboxylate transport system permease large subunit